MKKCDEVLELLSLYMDNELDEVRAKMVQEHIESCDDCKVELEQLCEVVKMCNDIDEIELPEEFKDELHQKLCDERQKIIDHRKIIVMRNRVLKTISSIAAVLLIVLMIRGVMNTGKNSLNGDFANSIMLQESLTEDNNEDKKMRENVRSGAVGEDVTSQVTAGQLFGDYKGSTTYDVTTQDIAGTKEGENNDFSKKANAPVAESTHGVIDKEKTDALSSDVIVAGVPEETPGNNVILQFNESVDIQFSPSALATDPNLLQSTISLTLNSENIEEDKLKLNKIASQFGYLAEENVNYVLTDQEVTAFNRFAGQGDNSTSGYKTSYIMVKTDYEKFIKEVNASFGGKVSVISDEGQHNTRLETINTSEKVKVTITIP